MLRKTLLILVLAAGASLAAKSADAGYCYRGGYGYGGYAPYRAPVAFYGPPRRAYYPRHFYGPSVRYYRGYPGYYGRGGVSFSVGF